ncbi:unnamed protein product, partial [Ectocarpus sp. 12 AP-2014]
SCCWVQNRFLLFPLPPSGLALFHSIRRPNSRVVEQLKGHRAVIRDIHHDPSRSVLVTASYDKTVKVWGER